MRRVNSLALALLLSACGKSEAPEAPPPASSSSVSAPAAQPVSNVDIQRGDAGQDRLVRIARFDCVTAADTSDATDFQWSKGIGLWAGGGPGGAAWNVGKLNCAVEFQSACTQGEADVELRVGGALAESRHSKIEHAGLQQVTVALAAAQWEKHLDQGSPLTERFPYRTATFSASVTASCEAPEVFGPSAGPRLEFADDRHFTAGFASGE